MATRTGIGVDVHPLAENRALVLGGVKIPHTHGLAGHSDGDVLVHAIIDAILGAAGLGDIGTHFPPGDEQYRGIDSTILLTRTVEIIAEENWRVQYVDATILAERPKLHSYNSEIRATLARSMRLSDGLVSVKATTTDGLGFMGRGEGIACMAVATLDDS
ncbi:MAG: 2-C-methyl-D-erythritol 2,4-cyclodiphosphate synthase [SAR202 cluster bacterium]|jgi:2-C-methyl-D-erythritol 2,4-cyclodiphosphate synthase|nr:2-C-methyl-D-erythritol 2,4-cyclodiphosphate synthase [SAR202 cluster bacterium]MDP6716404.1 2-C-methyl-D-erythritol 2,4-cyclodiphosphate synthase [SAR202 cluster bacterium]